MYNVFIQMVSAIAMLLGKILFHPQRKVYKMSSYDVQELLKSQYPDANFSLADRDYAYVDLDTWKKMFTILSSLLKPYIPEYRDCDDFRDFVKGAVSIFFAINSFFGVTGQNQNGTSHAFGMIMYREGDVTKLALVETQSLTIGCAGYKVSVIRG